MHLSKNASHCLRNWPGRRGKNKGVRLIDICNPRKRNNGSSIR